MIEKFFYNLVRYHERQVFSNENCNENEKNSGLCHSRGKFSCPVDFS